MLGEIIDQPREHPIEEPSRRVVILPKNRCLPRVREKQSFQDEVGVRAARQIGDQPHAWFRIPQIYPPGLDALFDHLPDVIGGGLGFTLNARRQHLNGLASVSA